MSITLNEKLFEEFQKTWTLERVKNMTLKEYTSVKGDGERDDFTYWIENQLDTLGSVWGGSAFKFGIYKRDRIEDKGQGNGRVYDKHYAWLEKYGKTQQEAFKKVKSLIIQVIECSRKNELAKIDKIDLGHAYKWKIAFHYQNPDNMKILCIFSKGVLKRIAERELDNGNLPTWRIYTQLMNDKKYTLETSIQERSKPLWKKYGNKNDKDDENEGDAMPNTPTTINPPLNQILYGPPGTGKTYNTINKALEILGVETQDESRAELKAKFDEFRQNGQIEFITFHQSFSYEEFVEGIKPKLIDFSEGAESGKMEYEIKSGIFKQICKKALKNLEDSQKDEAELKNESKVDDLFEAFIEHIQNEQENGGEYILKQNAEKDKNWLVVLLDSGNYKVIKIFSHSGYLEKYPVFLNGDKIKAHYSDFKADNSFKIPSNENRTGYIDTHRFYSAFFKKMQEFETTWQDISKDSGEMDFNQKALKPYILIIDEINRGNISKILGELITLIEPSKRIGGDEELRVSLPYSANEFDGGKGFGVPSNLYIIGTMNTADRSIALLDTALRRRFEFVEMMPQPELLKIIKVENGEINLQTLLETMNERIEFLLDREHTIGHSFFINVNSLSELKQVFKNKIIPLL